MTNVHTIHIHIPIGLHKAIYFAICPELEMAKERALGPNTFDDLFVFSSIPMWTKPDSIFNWRQ